MNAMKNLRRKTKKPITEIERECVPYSDAQAAEDVEFLKSSKVNAENILTIKEKIKQTSAYRAKMLTNLTIDLLEQFPYFFTDPALRIQ